MNVWRSDVLSCSLKDLFFVFLESTVVALSSSPTLKIILISYPQGHEAQLKKNKKSATIQPVVY